MISRDYKSESRWSVPEHHHITEEEFQRLHLLNTGQPDRPVEELPFYRWLAEKDHLPNSFVGCLMLYYAGHPLKGCFTPEQIETYRNIHGYYWWKRLNHEKDDPTP